MSHKSMDDIQDHIADHEVELLGEYLQDDHHWDKFCAWLWHGEQDSIREALFTHFLTCNKAKEYANFQAWAFEKMTDREG